MLHLLHPSCLPLHTCMTGNTKTTLIQRHNTLFSRVNFFRFETYCLNIMEYKTIEEDYPECKMEKVEKCFEPNGKTIESSNFVIPIPHPRKRCSTVDVMRCNIVKRTQRKVQPKHQCKRVPRKACVKYPCDESKEQCRVTVKLEREQRPEEECKLTPRRVCHQGECRPRLRRTCWCAGAEPGNNIDEDQAMPSAHHAM